MTYISLIHIIINMNQGDTRQVDGKYFATFIYKLPTYYLPTQILRTYVPTCLVVQIGVHA